jgi:hypothetical protein
MYTDKRSILFSLLKTRCCFFGGILAPIKSLIQAYKFLYLHITYIYK